ncbi:Acyl-CoA N-acyltransferase [Penicillium soppii]|jgi:GNAT superfamily N-acetyltransferase|uniref:Acyl-CoA N-acyltransferase n=1 Tax=Penicillium soppii TaxID=69789 RepID=UPI002546E36D|nr:Acyl-CoA N-acyltransferase [Penicillium soppii]KAJ5860541.1 Acyl-CoA N-acyltransferase [Penicillium soppii]
MTISTTSNPKIWTKAPYIISTDASQISPITLNTWFASEEVYWAKPMPEAAMRATLQNSLCFGLYDQTPNPKGTPTQNSILIGFARCITDTTTFVYLTDVFILPEHQGKGLGTWLIACVQEVIESMPYLRRSMLITSGWKRSVPFYEKLLGMEVSGGQMGADGHGTGLAVMIRKGKGAPGV